MVPEVVIGIGTAELLWIKLIDEHELSDRFKMDLQILLFIPLVPTYLPFVRHRSILKLFNLSSTFKIGIRHLQRTANITIK
jgi:hypothetical protein